MSYIDTVIQVENLGKKYVLGHQQEGRSKYKTLRESMIDRTKSLGKKLLRPPSKDLINPSREEFWALKDVSFEIKQGDQVGIIGRNGAGKSTLLKILSRITEPTSGSIRIKGRVASLLEVGTGFHPELSGRENIFLNGAILGMTKAEIQRKFDEIVAFAEIEKFLDTPVKRYSSGMYVRLAFAVAAHLEPEILIVDEVLAVGDAQFQKKCLGKMEDAGKEGRTVLFVSHNMGTITQLCKTGIYLKRGQIVDTGTINSVVSKYLMSGSENQPLVNLVKEHKKTTKQIFFTEIAIVNPENQISSEIDVRYPFYISLSYEVTKPLKNVELSVRIQASDGRAVLTTHQSDHDPESLDREVGLYKLYVRVPGMFLMPGSYTVSIGAHEPMVESYDTHEHVITFNINETGTRLAKYQNYQGSGIVMAELPWLENLQLLA
ncbi:MAG: ABC transporter ATP-binding protein [Stigonema ocellatum SAG 48.90 = DSM 106950]|nr:ABC transporter ATP-binding protein [Stigonema ocellatum SAG 48.90 = DSM 106950]